MDEILRKLTWVRETIQLRLNHTDIDGVIADLIKDIEDWKDALEDVDSGVQEDRENSPSRKDDNVLLAN